MNMHFYLQPYEVQAADNWRQLTGGRFSSDSEKTATSPYPCLHPPMVATLQLSEAKFLWSVLLVWSIDDGQLVEWSQFVKNFGVFTMNFGVFNMWLVAKVMFVAWPKQNKVPKFSPHWGGLLTSTGQSYGAETLC